MKKILSASLILFIIFFAFAFLLPTQAIQAKSCVGTNLPGAPTKDSLVQCGQFSTCQCEFTDFFQIILIIYNFIVWMIALPLAGLMILLGGVLILISGFNANWFATGKNILFYSLIALALIFGSWLIIDVVLHTIGYALQWNQF